jgi:NADH-quinone oxidoreductase subunit G
MMDTRDNVVVRLRPRPNMEVNRHFICDYGRLNYRWMNRGDRIEAPLVRDGARHLAADWDTAIAKLAALVQSHVGEPAVLLASAGVSTESLGLFKRLLSQSALTAAVRVPTGEEAPLAGIPGLALRKERVPNADGAKLLGYGTDWNGAMRAAASAALVLVLDAELTDQEALTLAAAPNLIVIGTVESVVAKGATLVLPTTTVAEENGTFVNRDRRVQRYLQAKVPPGMARPAWGIAADVLAQLGDPGAPSTAAEAFASLGRLAPALEGLTYQDLGLTGRVLPMAVIAGVAS